MAHSLILTLGLPILSVTAKPEKQAYFQDSSSKTAIGFVGALVDAAYPLSPDMSIGIAYDLELSSKFKTILSQGAEFYGKYYILGGTGILNQVAILSPHQATFNRQGQIVSEVEPLFSWFVQTGIVLRKFEMPQDSASKGKIVVEDAASVERRGVYLGPSFATGIDWSFMPRMRAGLRGFVKTSVAGLDNLSFTETGAAITFSHQFYQ